jgi:hypothetical protein
MNKNGITLFKETDYFTVFPEPKRVFASDVEKHLQHFMPLNLAFKKSFKWYGILLTTIIFLQGVAVSSGRSGAI